MADCKNGCGADVTWRRIRVTGPRVARVARAVEINDLDRWSMAPVGFAPTEGDESAVLRLWVTKDAPQVAHGVRVSEIRVLALDGTMVRAWQAWREGIGRWGLWRQTVDGPARLVGWQVHSCNA